MFIPTNPEAGDTDLNTAVGELLGAQAQFADADEEFQGVKHAFTLAANQRADRHAARRQSITNVERLLKALKRES